jgi:hypothetical protein
MLKQTTKALLESFRYRRNWLPRGIACRTTEAISHKEWMNEPNWGHEIERRGQINLMPYRKHLASLQTTERG